MNAVTLAPGLMVNLNLLHTFLTVAELKNFREAARQCNRSQSSVSEQIRQLEEQLSVPLFHRTTRSVSLTAHGEVLFERLELALQLIKGGITEAREKAGHDTDRIQFACSPSLAANFMPGLLRTFRKRNPRITIDITELPTMDMLDRIRTGEFLFGIGPIPPEQHGLDTELLAKEPFVALIPDTLKQSAQPAITLRQLVNLPLLMPTKLSITRRIIEASAKDQGLTFDISYECVHFRTLISMVESGAGTTVLPRSAIAGIRKRNYRAVLIDDSRSWRQLAILTRPRQSMPPAARKLLALAKREIDGYLSPGADAGQDAPATVPAPGGS
ncbi:LysR family transcriptional regulator [Salipiger sp.]|uniref:LysR family transcriptional regulator n=1 Tax=Salipiger sp. TaxID=2078585 RepID=UPI003A98660F